MTQSSKHVFMQRSEIKEELTLTESLSEEAMGERQKKNTD